MKTFEKVAHLAKQLDMALYHLNDMNVDWLDDMDHHEPVIFKEQTLNGPKNQRWVAYAPWDGFKGYGKSPSAALRALDRAVIAAGG